VNRFYDVAITELLEGELDLLVDPLAVSAWWGLYFDVTDVNVTDVYGNAVSTPAQPLAGRNVSGRVLNADPVTFTAVPETQRIDQLLLHRSDTGGLIAYIDQRPDLAPIFVQGNGGPVTFTWGGIGSVVISL
jgi:hypothetical protein